MKLTVSAVRFCLGPLFWPVGQAVKTSPFHGGITGSIPVRVITTWRITQVRLKGTVLKTVRWVIPRKGSNPLSSLHKLVELNETFNFVHLIFGLLYYYRGVEQLAARRAHNPEVAGSNPASAIYWSRGVGVITPACHAGDRGFNSRRDRYIAGVV